MGHHSCAINGNRAATRVQSMGQRRALPLKVALCGIKAAGCGVNLTAGSLVIITDSWCAPAIEEQAQQLVKWHRRRHGFEAIPANNEALDDVHDVGQYDGWGTGFQPI